MIPAYTITVDGEAKTFRDRLININLSDKLEEESDTLSLVFADHDGKLAMPRLGARIRISLGYDGAALVDKGEFIADAFQYAGEPDRLTVQARAADFRESLDERHEQSWHETSLGVILQTIAARNGLRLTSVAEIIDTLIKHVDQLDESDAGLLTRLARIYGTTVTVKDNRLLFLPRGRGKSASGASLPSVTISRSEVSRFRFEEGERESSHVGVVAFWHDYFAGLRYKVTAGKTKGKLKRLRGQFATQAEARAAAESEWQRLQRGKRSLRLDMATGHPKLIAESPVRIEGFKSDFDATDWIASEVTHTLNDQGYTTSAVLKMQM